MVAWRRSEVLSVNVRPYVPAALMAGLIFYFGINALTGDRGLLTHARRNAVLAFARLAGMIWGLTQSIG